MPLDILIYEYTFSLSSQQLDGCKEIYLSVLIILKDYNYYMSAYS